MGKFYDGCLEELKTYVRYSAWLNTAPEKPENAPTRIDKMRDQRNEPEYLPAHPDCVAIHVASYLWEVGPGVPIGMGMAPITQGEIRHWQDNTGITLNSWEARALRTLSSEYLEESHLAKNPARRAPWPPVPDKSTREEVSKRIRDVLRS